MRAHQPQPKRETEQVQRSPEPARPSASQAGAGRAPHLPLSPERLLTLQRTLGNTAVSRMLEQERQRLAAGRTAEAAAGRAISSQVPLGGPSSASPPVIQRMIYAEDGHALTQEEVNREAWYTKLHPEQQARINGLIEDEGAELSVESALEITRNTVVAAVNGTQKPEFDFLAEAWKKSDNLSAYDPEMTSAALGKEWKEIPTGTLTLEKSSVTTFGHHIPHTDLLVPHPGPWVDKASKSEDLASCIEYVLGENSVAYVLTDNEDKDGTRYAKVLVDRINEINNEKQNMEGYRPLVIEDTQATLNQEGAVRLGGVNLKPWHTGGYRVITISR
jgi:hypothetical protein